MHTEMYFSSVRHRMAVIHLLNADGLFSEILHAATHFPFLKAAVLHRSWQVSVRSGKLLRAGNGQVSTAKPSGLVFARSPVGIPLADAAFVLLLHSTVRWKPLCAAAPVCVSPGVCPGLMVCCGSGYRAELHRDGQFVYSLVSDQERAES